MTTLPQGTTGNPKGLLNFKLWNHREDHSNANELGALLTQGSLANSAHALCIGLDIENIVPLLLSYLPLAHIYEVRDHGTGPREPPSAYRVLIPSCPGL